MNALTPLMTHSDILSPFQFAPDYVHVWMKLDCIFRNV